MCSSLQREGVDAWRGAAGTSVHSTVGRIQRPRPHWQASLWRPSLLNDLTSTTTTITTRDLYQHWNITSSHNDPASPPPCHPDSLFSPLPLSALSASSRAPTPTSPKSQPGQPTPSSTPHRPKRSRRPNSPTSSASPPSPSRATPLRKPPSSRTSTPSSAS